MKQKRININNLLDRIDDKIVEKVLEIDNIEKYKEYKKISKNKNTADIIKQAAGLFTDNT